MSRSEKTVKHCRLQGKCGGCRYLNLPYGEQLKKKKKDLGKLLSAYGTVEDVIGCDEPYYYRNKVHHAFTRDRSGNIISGPYEANSHWILKCDICFIEDRKSQEIMHTIRDLIKKFKIRTYDEDRGTGVLRRVLIRRGFETNEIMVVLVIGSDFLPYSKAFVNALIKEKPEITTVVLNYNSKKTSMILGEKETVLYGKGYIYDVLCGKRFRISSKSFYQVNSEQTRKLYDTAIELAALTKEDMVIDAYCGIGTIGICASDNAGKVIGVELNGDAVKDARINAAENKTDNIEFYNDDAGIFMQKMAKEGKKADVVFMDPPRSGSTVKFMASMIKMSPDRIVYISCEPTSLARDLKYLTTHGYKCEKIKPVDMFPNTVHVESCVLLSRKVVNNNEIEYMHVDYEPEDAEYLRGIRGSATYAEIKKWIKEQYNVSVSSLYIAQCKDACGFEKRQNFNTGAEGHKVPNEYSGRF